MNLGEMADRVCTRIKRPDKRSEAIDAINNAISLFSLGASFAQDLVEDAVAINASQYEQAIQISTNFPRFRRIKYLKRPSQRGYLTQKDPLKIYDANGCITRDSWYRAGDYLKIGMTALSSTLDYGYYAYPTLLEDDDDEHWMLDAFPTMIFNKACGEMYDSIGEQQDGQRHDKLAWTAFEILKQDLETGGTPTGQ